VAAVRSAVASALQPASKSDVPVAAAKQPEAATKSAAEDLTTGLVSIQHATLEQLSEVPGLNRKLASEIIKARPFRSLDELAHVRGIGDASFRRLRTLLSL
jgi:DNA uptake protein ComE-like DNA-binding protein